jgi:hypothetical protein
MRSVNLTPSSPEGKLEIHLCQPAQTLTRGISCCIRFSVPGQSDTDRELVFKKETEKAQALRSKEPFVRKPKTKFQARRKLKGVSTYRPWSTRKMCECFFNILF